MTFPYHLLLLLFLSIPISECSNLSEDYYKKTCPDFERIVREEVQDKQIKQPTTAAGTLRLFFHDCMVDGCDGSILISTNSFNKAERDADINLSLPGDGFDIVVRIKTALELACPGVVSCADILAAATRNLIMMMGGPHYKVHLGRKDGLVSEASNAEGHLPTVNMSMDETIKIFANKGFSIQEMVALMGAHTIGFSNCKEFSERLFHYSKDTPTDPEYNPKYAGALKTLCSNYSQNGTMAAFNDVMTPNKFDNMYYKNLPRGLGLLSSDHALVKDSRTKSFVELYATNETAFFTDFTNAMMKLSYVGVKTDPKDGEVRRRCDAFNNVQV